MCITLHNTNTSPRRKLSDFDWTRAITWLQDRVGVREVARRLQVSYSVIIRLRERFQATGTVKERPRPDQPKKTTAREDRFIRRHALRTRTTTSNTIRCRLQAATNTAVCEMTIRPPCCQPSSKAPSPETKTDCGPPGTSPGLVHSSSSMDSGSVADGAFHR